MTTTFDGPTRPARTTLLRRIEWSTYPVCTDEAPCVARREEEAIASTTAFAPVKLIRKIGGYWGILFRNHGVLSGFRPWTEVPDEEPVCPFCHGYLSKHPEVTS